MPMSIDHKQLVSRLGIAALALRTVAFDRFGLKTFFDRLDTVAVA